MEKTEDMSYQEPLLYQDIQELENSSFESGTTTNHLAMLHLNPTTTTATATTTDDAPVPSLQKCTKCGTLTRRSSSSLQPSSKRLTLQSPSSSTSITTTNTATAEVSNHQNLNADISPITSPPPSSTRMQQQHPPLQRSVSDPINTTQMFDSFAALCQALNAQSPENSKNIIGSSTSLPPPPQAIYRTLSDPTSAAYQVVAAATPPPLVLPQEESPNTKRLKRMKHRMREMSQWWDQIIHEEDEHIGSEGGITIDNNYKDEKENEPEEAVWIEKRNGDGLIVHFKCPCGEAYEIFLWENNCYYKLM